jgi:hypothetical protein
VEVTKNGKIDGACNGKNIWDDKIRGFAPCHLNMAIVKVGGQNVVDMAAVCRDYWTLNLSIFNMS